MIPNNQINGSQHNQQKLIQVPLLQIASMPIINNLQNKNQNIQTHLVYPNHHGHRNAASDLFEHSKKILRQLFESECRDSTQQYIEVN